MQDITPDLVTPEQLVNEILRREQQMQCGIVNFPSSKSPSSGGFVAPTCVPRNNFPLMRNSEQDDPNSHPQYHDEENKCVEMESRRSSMTKAMSIDEEAEEDEDNCNTIKAAAEPGCRIDCTDDEGGGGGGGTTSASSGNGNNVKESSSEASEVVILDCQNPADFQECHIRGALNVTFPAIMIRRIAAGKIDIFEKSKELKNKIANSKLTFVVYDSFNPVNNQQTQQHNSTSNLLSLNKEPGLNNLSPINNQHSNDLSDLVNLIARKLAQNGCRVATLKGGLPLFRELYPEWIDSVESKRHPASSSTSSSSAEPSPDPLSRTGEVPLLGLGSLASLKIQDDPDACDSSIGLDSDDAFPVEIIRNLYLGNASISSDLSVLEKHNIKHILNVTPDLPNVFEGTMRYLQIPISDHWTQSMLNHFVPAIQFIDEGRSKEEGVLIHCLAGISRSVTITMAYLMYKMNLSLNDAYDIVRAKKSNISPNFHFMGQLLDFERQLSSQFLSPPALGSSPDSGIEFDRWNSN